MEGNTVYKTSEFPNALNIVHYSKNGKNRNNRSIYLPNTKFPGRSFSGKPVEYLL